LQICYLGKVDENNRIDKLSGAVYPIEIARIRKSETAKLKDAL